VISGTGHGTVLAFDFGEKRIGVAVGELSLRIPHPVNVITAEDNRSRFAAIQALIEEWRPVLLIVGRCVNDDGAPHETGLKAQRFGNRLHGRFGLPVEYVDERLTSAEAAAKLRATGVTGHRQSGLLDAVAAEEILHTWFSLQTAPGSYN
jgi:putative Holliday junction resolvase